MNKEKMLIKVERKNIFKKVINFIKNIFSKKQETNMINTEYRIKNNSFISELEENRKILIMQKSFESGELKEADLTETEKNNLIKLYNQQIRDLQKNVEDYNRSLEFYKEKILVVKSKLNN